MQIEGVDYGDKYAPVVAWSTVRTMMRISLKENWKSRQVDFANAFVQADLKEDVYITMPPGFSCPDYMGQPKDLDMKLDKSLYGLVQAPLYWYNKLTGALASHGFEPSDHDKCLFYGNGMVALIYVDDVVFFGPDQDKIDKLINSMRDIDKFNINVEDDFFHFLGVDISKDDDTFTLKQTGLIEKILRTVKIEECNGKETPAMKTPLSADTYGTPFKEDWEYASVIGMLFYLCSNSRPDIQFAVHQCARFNHCPRKSHDEAVKIICRYLQATKNKGLIFNIKTKMKLDMYVDADFAGLYDVEDHDDPICVKSRTGYVLILGGCPISWASKLQTEIALSTLEAEYIALSTAMRELLPQRELLKEIGKKMKLDFVLPSIVHSTVFEDNNGALTIEN